MDSKAADQDVQTVIELELRLLRPEVRAEPGTVAALLHPDFSEFGASGRRWGRTEIVAALAAEQPGGEEPHITATDMAGTRLADDVIHLTYVSQRGERRALRSSVWLRTQDGWRVYFHQGTLATESGSGSPHHCDTDGSARISLSREASLCAPPGS
jgi:hypothetical protein